MPARVGLGTQKAESDSCPGVAPSPPAADRSPIRLLVSTVGSLSARSPENVAACCSCLLSNQPPPLPRCQSSSLGLECSPSLPLPPMAVLVAAFQGVFCCGGSKSMVGKLPRDSSTACLAAKEIKTFLLHPAHFQYVSPLCCFFSPCSALILCSIITFIVPPTSSIHLSLLYLYLSDKRPTWLNPNLHHLYTYS